MLKRCIQAENRKLHASPIWGLFFALPLISAIYGTFNYLQNLGNSQRWLVQSLDTAYIVLFDVFLSCNGGCLCSLSVETGTSWTQLESYYGKSGQADRSFSGEICCGGKTGPSDASVCIFAVCILWKSFCTFSGISTDDPACFSSSRCSGSTCGHCGAACAGYGHPKLCHSDLSWAGGRHHRSAGREQRSFSVLALCTDAGRHECKQE